MNKTVDYLIYIYYMYALLLVKRLNLLRFVARSLTPELCVVYPIPQTTFTVCVGSVIEGIVSSK